MRAYIVVNCRNVEGNIIPAANIVKLPSFHHLFAANFIISTNDTIQAVTLKCQKKWHLL
jgi:hypothetical protein